VRRPGHRTQPWPRISGKTAFSYLEACRNAVEGDDPNRPERHRLRRASEAALREQLGHTSLTRH
jgi:hypothetical protein